MDYGHTNQQGFFTEGVGNSAPDSNPDIADSLNEQEYGLDGQSSQALGNAALNANHNSVPENIPNSEFSPNTQINSYFATPSPVGQILPVPGSLPPSPELPDPAKPSRELPLFSYEHGHIVSSEINRAATNPSDFYEAMLESRNKGENN